MCILLNLDTLGNEDQLIKRYFLFFSDSDMLLKTESSNIPYNNEAFLQTCRQSDADTQMPNEQKC